MEDRTLSDVVWTPERGLSEPEIRGIAWDNFLLSDEYGGKWRTDAGVRVTPDTALQSTVVLASCRILAESIASLPIHVYRRTEKSGRERATDIPLYKVLSFAPNGWQTKFEFFEQIVMNLCLWGNSYTQIKSGRYGAVSELINLHPSRMDVERLENGRLRYSYTNPETGRLERYTQDQIMHVRWTPEPDGIKGMVPVEIAREAIALARACESHAAKYWANSARPGVVLQTDGSLSPEAAERLRDNWERLHRGSQNAWRTAVLTNGLKAEPLGFSAEQSQAIESRRFSVEEISRVYRLPLHLIQGTSGGNLEVQGQEFVTYTLLPWLRRIESAISRSLIYNDDIFFAEFDVRGLLRSDSNSRAAYYSTMTNLGILSVNECRAFENLPPLEHGDNHFVAMNMQTLEEASKPKQDPMAAMMAGAGSPPPATGGVPSLPGVKTGKAPSESEQGEASEKKQPIAEGDIVTWDSGRIGEVKHVMSQGTLDLKDGKKIDVAPGSPVALVVDAETGEEEGVKISELTVAEKAEARAFCPTGDGGGVDNSCGSGETSSAKAARIRNTERTLPKSIEAGDSRLTEYQQFSPSAVSDKNSDHVAVPSDSQILQALSSDKSPKFGKNRDLPEGQRVALRIDIPAYERHDTYAVTVHEESKSKSGVGSAVGYDSIVRLVGDVSFKADEKTATQIAIGRSKTPLATVVGSLTQNRDIPDDIDDWTPVGYNPKKAAYFFDKKSGREVVGGTDSISVGNTVFVRVPKYGDRNAAKQYRSYSFWGTEVRELSPQNESLYEAQETIAESKGKWPQEGPSGAHYMEQNPFASRGIACKNCVYFQSGNQCEIVSGAIQPTAICKLWVIPEEKLSLMPEERAFCPTGDGGGVDNSCGSGESSSGKAGKIAEMAIKSVAETKGFSIHPVSVTSPSTGYMVSVEPESETILDSEESITADAISKFMDENKAKFESRPTLHVGGWIDSRTGSVYLDLSERFDDIDDAIDAAESTSQLAIWDLNEKKEIRKEDYGARRKRGGETRAVRLSDGGDCGADRRGASEGEKRSDGEEGRAKEVVSRVDDGWGSASESSRSIVATASGMISSMPNVVYRAVGNSVASYDPGSDTIYVNPSLEPHHVEALSSSAGSGWLSQPNPILHEYSHRYHLMSDPEGYEASCRKDLSAEQRSLIAEKVSRYAATNTSEFIAEYIAGRLSGKTYGDDVKQIVGDVTSGAVRL